MGMDCQKGYRSGLLYVVKAALRACSHLTTTIFCQFFLSGVNGCIGNLTTYFKSCADDIKLCVVIAKCERALMARLIFTDMVNFPEPMFFILRVKNTQTSQKLCVITL